MQTMRMLAILLLATAVSACSAIRQADPVSCGVAGALLAGGALAGVADEIDSDWDDEGDAAAVGGVGAVAGGLLGWAVCSMIHEEAAPPPPPPAPKPVAKKMPPPPPPPPPAPKADPCKGAVRLEGVKFATDSAAINSDAAMVLDSFAAALKRCPQNEVRIEAHTDSTGSADYNQSLSERRAKSVMDYLVSQGVDGSSLTSRGYGETQPVGDNTTREGRAANRRVMLNPVQ